MEGFKASFINEIEKMYKKKKAVVVIVISLLAIILGQLMILGVRGLGIKGTNGTAFPILVLDLFVNTILPLFTALVAIDVFTGEYAQNTMKIILVRPVTRFKLFLAKIAAIAFFVTANLLIVMLLSTLVGFLFNGTSNMVGGLIKIVLSYLVTLMPVMTLALIIVLLANILKSGGAVFFLAIIIFIVFKALGIVYSKYSNLFVTSMFDWYKLWIADSMPILKILRLFLIMLGSGIMFFITGYYLFDKKEL